MRRRGTETRRLIIEAADDLFYGEGVRGAGVDAIAKRAGVTKRTLYYHFASKDQLVAAYLESRDQPTLKRLKSAMRAKDLASSVRALFKLVGSSGVLPTWKGCAFTRVIHELAGQPGHPACVLARRHKKGLEQWFEEQIEAAGISKADERARELLVLMDGAITQMLTHRDPIYAEAALRAALVCLGLEGQPRPRPR